MKNKFLPAIFVLKSCISALLLSVLLSCTGTVNAQDIHGSATVTVKKQNEAAKTFNYPDDFPNTLYNCNQTGKQGDPHSYTDFGFSKSFDKFKNADGTPPIVSVQMRIGPCGKGTFPLKTKDSNQPKGDLNIDLNTPAHPLNDFYDDCNGTITITQYPPIGGYIVGSFNATLKDASGNAYTVNGKFKIKRQSDSQ